MLVIKIGGGDAIGAGGYANFAADLAELNRPAVIVHGGNAEFSRLSRELGMPPRMITSASGRVTRYTDAATIDVMLMAYAGKVNKRLVATLQAAGVNAVGLSAIDGRIARGRRKPVLRGTEDGKTKVLRDDHAGTLEEVEPRLIRLLLDAGYLPVLTPPALGEEGMPINVDGDKLALELAIALGADGLLFFSDTPGLLANRDDERSLIREIDASAPEAALAAAAGRMTVKVEAALGAIARGVGQVVFADGRAEHPVQRALAGEGTVVRARAGASQLVTGTLGAPATPAARG
ncbi:MAG: [LysW]-aminoadipate kinase [Chloroflexota bacterium]|nr:[LysW]-aminoadipate kinase [Chloroflexota bacterium]